MRERDLAIAAAILLAVLVLWTDPGGVVTDAIDTVTGTRRSFLSTIGSEVARQLSELRPDLSDAERVRSAAIVAAQAAHETGYGRSTAWRNGFNFGNVTAGSSWRGAVVNGGDKDGSGKPITQAFRAYPDLASAVSDFLGNVLGWSRYRAARDALYAGDAAGYVSALRSGGYFTAPESTYLAGLSAALPAAEGALS